MQRISAFWSSRDRPKPNVGLSNPIPAPAPVHDTTNALTRRYGPEDYWPSTLDRESEKAARILQAFCSTSHLKTHIIARAPANMKAQPRVA